MPNGETDGLTQLIAIVKAETTQEALGRLAAFQESSYRKLIQGIGNLNAGVDRLTKSTKRLSVATWFLVGLTVVLAALTGVLVWRTFP